MAAIDVDGLESAVQLGICETADYTADPATDLGSFLLGVDAVPSHIGANYDVIRGAAPSRPELTVCEVCGRAKHGAAHTKVLGYHPLVAVRDTGEVLHSPDAV